MYSQSITTTMAPRAPNLVVRAEVGGVDGEADGGANQMTVATIAPGDAQFQRGQSRSAAKRYRTASPVITTPAASSQRTTSTTARSMPSPPDELRVWGQMTSATNAARPRISSAIVSSNAVPRSLMKPGFRPRGMPG